MRHLRVIAAVMLAIIVAPHVMANDIPANERRSGATFMAPETQAMQADDTANPGMLGVIDGEALWNSKLGAADKSCASCHTESRTSMNGVAARYPAFDETLKRPVDLEQRVNLCRVNNQQAPPLTPDSREMLALTALIGRQSRGMAIGGGNDPRLAPFVEKGREIFTRRQGQLNLGCANCHDDNWNKRLIGSAITQGHPTGYPVYRLEWQGLGSLQRRLRNCMVGMRAQPFEPDGPEAVALELFLMSRARGMLVETPAVRP